MKKHLMLMNEAGDGTDLGGSAALPDFGNDFTPPDLEEEVVDDDKAAQPAGSPGTDDDLEGEETAEERLAREEEEARVEREARIRIPKARFDEAVDKERRRAEAAERRAAELEEAMQQRQQAGAAQAVTQARQTLAQLQDKYEELLVDGMREEARQVRTQIEHTRDQLQEARLAQIAEEARSRTLTTIKYETTLSAIESQYPELNPDGAQFSEDKANEVARLMQAFMSTGDDNVSALKQAVRYVMGAPAAAPAKAPAAKPEDRAVAARQKAAAAAARQPQPSDLTGASSAAAQPVPLKRMSMEQFSKLDEATLAKMRGDELA